MLQTTNFFEATPQPGSLPPLPNQYPRLDFYRKIYDPGQLPEQSEVDAQIDDLIKRLCDLPGTQERSQNNGEPPVGIRRQDLILESINQFIKSGILESQGQDGKDDGKDNSGIKDLIYEFKNLYNAEQRKSHNREIAINLLERFFYNFSNLNPEEGLILAVQLLERCEQLLCCNEYIEKQQQLLDNLNPQVISNNEGDISVYRNPRSLIFPGILARLKKILNDKQLLLNLEKLGLKEETLFNKIGRCFAKHLLENFDAYWKTNVAYTTNDSSNDNNCANKSPSFKGYLTIQKINIGSLQNLFSVSDRIRSKRHLASSLQSIKQFVGDFSCIQHISSWFEYKPILGSQITSVKTRIKSFLSVVQKDKRPNRGGYGLIFDQFGITVYVKDKNLIPEVLKKLFSNYYNFGDELGTNLRLKRLGAQPTKWDSGDTTLDTDIQYYAVFVDESGQMVGPPFELRVSCKNDKLSFPNNFLPKNLDPRHIIIVPYKIEKLEGRIETPKTHLLATGKEVPVQRGDPEQIGESSGVNNSSNTQELSPKHHLFYKQDINSRSGLSELIKWLMNKLYF